MQSAPEIDMEQIWNDYHAALKAFLHSRVDNSSDVDDLLQDIIIKSHQKLPDLKQQSKLKSWLFQIAHNSISDFYRGQLQRQNLQRETLWYDESNQPTRHALEQCLMPFINALPAEQRDLLLAVELQDKSQKEIATSLGVPYSTLKSRIKKSREAMHRLFEHCCELSFDAQGRVIEYQPKSGHCRDC